MSDAPPAPVDGGRLLRDLRRLGVAPGQVVMVHASLKAIGPVEGGAATVASALLQAVSPGGGLLAFGSWAHSPYMETLGGRELDPVRRAAWPAFEPATAETYPGFGLLNEFLRRLPGAGRSPHPDASMIGVGAAAPMVADHPLGHAYGPGSPLERLLAAGGRVLLLGAPLDALTVLHYAEAVADIPGKRRVRYRMPFPREGGGTRWEDTEDFDSNGILDCYAGEGRIDAVEAIARDYVRAYPPVAGMVGQARTLLFDAVPLVDYGRRWLERRHGRPPACPDPQETVP